MQNSLMGRTSVPDYFRQERNDMIVSKNPNPFICRGGHKICRAGNVYTHGFNELF
jgi:hypothetical protein